MTEEDKKLLMIDLCGRIPYGVKVEAEIWMEDEGEYTYVPDKVYSINSDGYIVHGYDEVYECKPYLFPLSSITEEQMEELEDLCDMYTPYDDYHPYAYKGIKVLYKHVLDDGYEFNFKTDVIDWFNKNHFDYRGLIDKGLAIDATNKNIY